MPRNTQGYGSADLGRGRGSKAPGLEGAGVGLANMQLRHICPSAASPHPTPQSPLSADEVRGRVLVTRGRRAWMLDWEPQHFCTAFIPSTAYPHSTRHTLQITTASLCCCCPPPSPTFHKV